MAKMKKGFLKKTGCILISASIILTGVTFFGGSTSSAEGEEEVTTETTVETTSSDDTTSTGTEENLSGGTTTDATTEGGASTGTETAGETTGSTTDATTTTGENTTDATTGTTTETTEITEETDADTADDEEILNTKKLKSTMSLMSNSLLTSDGNYTDESTGAVYTDSSMTTLVSVPSSATSFEVPSSVRTIQSEAFSGSNVTYLKFTSDVSSIGSESSWPLVGTTTIDCSGMSSDTNVVTHYKALMLSYVGTSTVIKVLFEDSSEETASYTLTYKYYVDDYSDENNLLGSEARDYDEGDDPELPDARKTFSGTSYSYVSGPYPDFETVSGDAEYKFVYKKVDSDTYTVRVFETLYESNGTTVISGPTQNADLSGDYLENYVITPTAPSGYEIFGDITSYTVTNVASQDVYFTYKKTTTPTPTPTPGGGGGNSGGGGSSSGVGSSSGGSSGGSSSSSSASAATPAPGTATTVADVAKLNNAYHIIEGASQVVPQTNGPVRIVCDGPVEKLAYIMMDGNIIPRENYTIESGSTILNLTKDYVANLAVGDHAVQFQYIDGYAVTGLKITAAAATKTTTTVTYKVSSDGTISSGHVKDTTPKTADGFDTRYLLCLAIFLLGAGSIMMSKQKKLEAILAGEMDEE